MAFFLPESRIIQARMIKPTILIYWPPHEKRSQLTFMFERATLVKELGGTIINWNMGRAEVNVFNPPNVIPVSSEKSRRQWWWVPKSLTKPFNGRTNSKTNTGCRI
jgi:hypothetical protein